MDIFNRQRVNSHENTFDIDIDELNEESPRSEQPQNVQVILKDHQLTLLNRAIQFENRPIHLKEYQSIANRVTEEDCFYTNVGVIADRVGSGKSYVMLALFGANDIYNNHRTVIRSSAVNNVSFHLQNTATSLKTNVLVVPFNLCSQWETYITTFSDRIRYKVINKSRTLAEMSGHIQEQSNQYDIFLISSTFYNRFVPMARAEHLKFQRVAFDEADNIMFTSCPMLDACFYWFITASYGNLLYPKGFVRSEMNRMVWYAHGIRSSGFIRNIFIDLHYTVPKDIFKTLIIKNTEAYVQQSIELPPMNSYTIVCKTPHSIRVLYDIVDKNIISCLNAGDTERALQYVNPSQKMSEDNIIQAIISKYTIQLSNTRVKLSMLDQMQYQDENEMIREKNHLEQKEKDILKNIELIKERIVASESCHICCEPYERKTVVKCCQNSFCFKCLQIWMSRRAVCPLCKEDLTNDMLLITCNDSEASTSTYVEEPDYELIGNIQGFKKKNTKIQNLEILLKTKNNNKLLIFSNYDSSFDKIYPVLRKYNIRYDCLKGNSVHVNNTIEKYRNGDTNVLLVNTQYYGSGLNLENTTDIVMFHKFNTEIEKQVIGRAQRFGRTIPLNVWYLLHENE